MSYAKHIQSIVLHQEPVSKNGKAPIMGRITVNGTQAGFSSKRTVSLSLWDVKANRAKGKSEEARTLNQELDNIKAQITKHYQYICDHDSFVTAKKVYNRYVGFAEECHTLMVLFREQIESYKEKIGKGKAESTYRGLVADYKSLLLFMKTKKNIEDIAIDELEKSFIEDYYTWMLGTAGNANATAFNRVNTLKWLMYIAQEKGWLKVHPFTSFECKPEYKKRSFLTEEELQRIIHVDLNTNASVPCGICFSSCASPVLHMPTSKPLLTTTSIPIPREAHG